MMGKVTEVRLGLRALALVVVTAVLAPTAGTPLALAVLACCVGAAAVLQPPPYAALLAVTAWCLLTGFVEHDDALLTFAGTDLVHLGVLLAAAAAGTRAPVHAHRTAVRQTRAQASTIP